MVMLKFSRKVDADASNAKVQNVRFALVRHFDPLQTFFVEESIVKKTVVAASLVIDGGFRLNVFFVKIAELQNAFV